MSSDEVTFTLTREQAQWLLDAADRGTGAWGIHPDDARPAFEAMEILEAALNDTEGGRDVRSDDE